MDLSPDDLLQVYDNLTFMKIFLLFCFWLGLSLGSAFCGAEEPAPPTSFQNCTKMECPLTDDDRKLIGDFLSHMNCHPDGKVEVRRIPELKGVNCSNGSANVTRFCVMPAVTCKFGHPTKWGETWVQFLGNTCNVDPNTQACPKDAGKCIQESYFDKSNHTAGGFTPTFYKSESVQ